MRERLGRLLLSDEPIPHAGAVVAILALCGAMPFLLCPYLPLVDFPMHQLELAIWLGRSDDGHGFGNLYEHASPLLPYWLPVWLGAGFSYLTGVAAGLRMVVALYALALPLVSMWLCRLTDRSPWFALLVVPFLYELNLRYGFVAYCLSGLLWLLALAFALRAERAPAAWPLAGLALVSLLLGFTHAQTAVLSSGSVVVLQLLRRGPRRLAISLAAALTSLPLALWLSRPGQAHSSFSGAPFFASPLEQLARLPILSFDAFPDHVDETLFVLVLGCAVLLWLSAREKLTIQAARPMVLAAAALVGAFVLPWDWNGQALSQRMPYLALILLPVCLPAGVVPAWRLLAPMVLCALVGVLHTGLAIAAFSADTEESLGALIEATPSEPRVAYFGFDAMTSPWVRGPVYAHAGAWLVLARGGVYAEHFERLTSRYGQQVPRDQILTRTDFEPVRTLAKRDSLDFWNVLLVRWPRGRGPLPVTGPSDGYRVQVAQPFTLWVREQP